MTSYYGREGFPIVPLQVDAPQLGVGVLAYQLSRSGAG
jgi:hypothetical protein